MRKIISFSIDDGCEDDLELLAAFKEMGIRATFNLNTGLLGASYFHPALERTVTRLPRQAVSEVYQGHETASHTVSHPFLDRLSDQAIQKEVETDRAELNIITGHEANGLALPFGPYPAAFHSHLAALFANSGLCYIRTGCRALKPCIDGILVHPFMTLEEAAQNDSPLDEKIKESSEIFFCVIAGHGYDFTGMREEKYLFLKRLERLSGEDGTVFLPVIEGLALWKECAASIK